MIRVICGGLVLGLVLVSLLGCGGESEVGSSEGEKSLLEEVVTVAAGEGVEGGAGAASGLGRGGVLTPVRGGVFLYEGHNRIVADPAFPGVGGSLDLHREVFSGLMRVSMDEGVVVEPDLAERFTVSEDGLNYEFVLKRGLKFSDGSPLTARDFKWSWERALSRRTDSAHARRTLGMIVGAAAVMEGTSYDLSGVEIVDDRTIEVSLSVARGDFPVLLADPSASVLKKSNVENWRDEWSDWYPDEDDFYRKRELPVGTGPFKVLGLDTYPDTIEVVLGRNDHYHGRAAYLDGVKWVVVSPQLLGQERRDEMDRVFDAAGLDAYRVDWESAESEIAGERGTKALPYLVEDDTGTFFMIFNPSIPPFDDRHFRRALVAASDVWALESLRPGREIRSRITPPGMPHHSEDVSSLGFDPLLAQIEWERSRYVGEEIDLVFHTPYSYFFEDELARLSEDWRSLLGINSARVEVTSFEDWEFALELGEIGMAAVFQGALNPDPHAIFGIFETVWGEDVDSDEYDELLSLLSASAGEQDRAERLRLYGELEQHILDEALAMPLWWFDRGYYIRAQPWVHGYVPPKWPVSQFKDVWFDDSAPERSLLE